MAYKQPIETSVFRNEKMTGLAQYLFTWIMIHARNTPESMFISHGGKTYQVDLNRGQCILKIAMISNQWKSDGIKIGRTKINTTLKILKEVLRQNEADLNIEGKPYGHIITVINYDNLVSPDDAICTGQVV